jgi:serine/threonine protein kinase
MVLEYAEGGSFSKYLKKNYENFDWFNGIKVLTNVIGGHSEIHQKRMVYRDFHLGNILLTKNEKKYNNSDYYNALISDMGLCRKIDDIDEKSIYGVMPYVAPEVLKGKSYTQVADIYSFGMIMYVVATGEQPFANCAHDEILALNICNGVRPEIKEKIAPRCYIDLMKKCWDSNPDNRPNSIEIKESIDLFYNSLHKDQYYLITSKKEQQYCDIEVQFEQTQEYRKEIFLSIKNNQLTTHTKAIYASRLLNPFTKDLTKYNKSTDISSPNYDNTDNYSGEVIDFTKLIFFKILLLFFDMSR